MPSTKRLWLSLVACAACVTPQLPGPDHPPAPDRYERAASPDRDARASAATELVYDPSPRAGVLLATLLLRDVDPLVRIRAAEAIEARRDPSLDELLVASAGGDPDPAVRAAADASHRRLWPLRKRPGTAAGLSLLCPGCGQLYLGETREGLALVGGSAGLIASAFVLIDGHGVSLDGTADSARVPIGAGLAVAGQNLWFYSIFDAYRDARVMRGERGYRHSITRESLGDLVSAPFRPRVLASPWVWAGVPLAVGAGILASYLASPGDFRDVPSIFDVDRVNVLGRRFRRGPGFALGSAFYGALFAPVGVGEEALFRGLIQTELMERFGTYGGLAASSAIFGAVHIVNFLDDPKQALLAVPVISVLGSSLGLAYIRTGHQLSTSVAMHFWYDTLLSVVAFAVDPTHQPFVVQYGSSM